MTRAAQCPTCGRPVAWSDAFPYRPFCSERCKLIDLGAWASGQRAIPADAPPDGSLPEHDEGDSGKAED